ncbi:MAG TPA: hypothetical protein PLD23_07295 [Armatimonadota bacterium]|nr:hypothetical protein [Armatimonadota bacterium]
MGFWKALWAVMWFGGLALFAVLAVIVTYRGALDVAALLKRLSQNDQG